MKEALSTDPKSVIINEAQIENFRKDIISTTEAVHKKQKIWKQSVDGCKIEVIDY